MSRTVSIQVPASTSNLGAGFDCVGVALSVWLRADVSLLDIDDVGAALVAALSTDHDAIAKGAPGGPPAFRSGGRGAARRGGYGGVLAAGSAVELIVNSPRFMASHRFSKIVVVAPPGAG